MPRVARFYLSSLWCSWLAILAGCSLGPALRECSSATLAGPIRAYDVARFGAVANDGGKDAEAIQKAIACARATDIRAVYFPSGRYLLERPLIADVDGLTLFGNVNSILVVDPEPRNIDRYPEAILVNREVKHEPSPAPTRAVTIRDLTFEVRNGSDKATSYGVIQLNNCEECVVQDVRMFWGGAQPAAEKPRNVDGIVVSQGSSGVISRVVVDGIPKAGIYVAEGAHDVVVELAEVMRTEGPQGPQFGGTGILVTGATRVSILDCRSHDNASYGLLVATNGPIGTATPVAATHVRVAHGHYDRNGSDGIRVASGWPEAVPHHVQLAGVSASLNGDAGLTISGAEDVLVSDALLHDNGAQGLLIETPKWTGTDRRTERIAVSSPVIFDNGCCTHPHDPGIQINTANDVTIEGGRAYATGGSSNSCTREVAPAVLACAQNIAVSLRRDDKQRPNDNIRILDLDVSAGPAGVTAVATDPYAAPIQGHYRLQGAAPPAFEAPDGSLYTDVLSGITYRRVRGAWVTP